MNKVLPIVLLVAALVLGALLLRQSGAHQNARVELAQLQEQLQTTQSELDSTRQAITKLASTIADHEQAIHDLTAENERLHSATKTQKKEKGDGDNQHLWAAWVHLQGQVKAGVIEEDDAERRMGVIKEESVAVMRELRSAVAAGELTGAEGRAKWAGYKANLLADFEDED
ncbi:MAG: septal ring factor EnvC (AmiA/AmiB activator) [Rhodothermales bacterium]|jgi:septal ring factor EnvC (AmiA/AmiB activator)